jgi:hypothetical protein
MLLATSASAEPIHSFPDVPMDHDNARAIAVLQRFYTLKGYPDGAFRPDRSINRAEFVKLLGQPSVDEEMAMTQEDCFPDVPVNGTWYAAYVCNAKKKGWVGGYPDGSFKPEQGVTMAEALKILIKAGGYDLTEHAAFPLDGLGVDPTAWYAPYLKTALAKDIVSPETIMGADGERLDQPLTRKRVAEFLYRSILADGVLMLADGYDLRSDPLSRCKRESVKRVEAKKYDAKKYADGTVQVDIDVIGIDRAGKRCVFARNVNPYAFVSRHWNSRMLFLDGAEMMPDGSQEKAFDDASDYSFSFSGGHETAGLDGHHWDLPTVGVLLTQED